MYYPNGGFKTYPRLLIALRKSLFELNFTLEYKEILNKLDKHLLPRFLHRLITIVLN